mmetsp:Transcript_136811/g.292243  ORF Transcript_136811/g.292243 Transcript_136811/m.292243 type:complete len:251 (-) Transcript_136811:1263-2015(-)
MTKSHALKRFNILDTFLAWSFVRCNSSTKSISSKLRSISPSTPFDSNSCATWPRPSISTKSTTSSMDHVDTGPTVSSASGSGFGAGAGLASLEDGASGLSTNLPTWPATGLEDALLAFTGLSSSVELASGEVLFSDTSCLETFFASSSSLPYFLFSSDSFGCSTISSSGESFCNNWPMPITLPWMSTHADSELIFNFLRCSELRHNQGASSKLYGKPSITFPSVKLPTQVASVDGRLRMATRACTTLKWA